MGKSPEEALIDLVEADRANVFVARFSMNEDDLQYALRRPWVAIDLDAGAFSLDGPFGEEQAPSARARHACRACWATTRAT